MTLTQSESILYLQRVRNEVRTLTNRNKRLVAERERLGVSQSEAAKGIGITPGMYAMLETGDRKGSDETKRKVASYFGVSIEYLFFGGNFTLSEDRKEATK